MKSAQQPRRRYRQRARAEAVERNTERIVASAEELFSQRYYDEVTLDHVAGRAGVGLQTLIRRFPTKEALVTGVGDAVRARILAQRGDAPVGDVAGIVRNLADHYEATAHITLLLLAQEDRVPPFARYTKEGRQLHRAWVERVFAPWLAGLSRAERELRIVQLIALCDLYVWKLLRRDQGLSRARYERAVNEMIERLLEEGS